MMQIFFSEFAELIGKNWIKKRRTVLFSRVPVKMMLMTWSFFKWYYFKLSYKYHISIWIKKKYCKMFTKYFLFHKNVFPIMLKWNRKLIPFFFKMIPTKYPIRYLCYILIGFDKSLVTLTHIFSSKSIL